jgi:hypothetical protein
MQLQNLVTCRNIPAKPKISRIVYFTESDGESYDCLPDSASLGWDAICSEAWFVGVRTTGDRAFEAIFVFPEGCVAVTDGSSGSIVCISALVLMVLAYNSL